MSRAYHRQATAGGGGYALLPDGASWMATARAMASLPGGSPDPLARERTPQAEEAEAAYLAFAADTLKVAAPVSAAPAPELAPADAAYAVFAQSIGVVPWTVRAGRGSSPRGSS